MKKMFAIAAAVSLGGALPVWGLGSESTLHFDWRGEEVSVENGEMIVAEAIWSRNDAHGHVDEREGGLVRMNVELDNAMFVNKPPICVGETTMTSTSLTCDVEMPDDDGIQGKVVLPIRPWGADGSQAVGILRDDLGNEATTRPMTIEATQGFDVALNAIGLTQGEYAVTEGVMATTLVPVMVSVPLGGEKLSGFFEAEFDIATSSGPDVGQEAQIRVVPTPHVPDLVGLASSTEMFPVPDVELVHEGRTVRVRVPLPDEAYMANRVDPAGNEFDVIPVLGFSLEVTHPVSDGRNSASAWTVRVTDAAVTGGSELTEQIRLTNDETAVSIVDGEGASARFVNGSTGPMGGILADQHTDVEAGNEAHMAVWDPGLGTGVLMGAAADWVGRGPVLPGDQLMGITSTNHYVGGYDSDGKTHGMCVVFDRETARFNGKTTVLAIQDYTMEYLTGEIPGGFGDADCGGDGWVANQPASEDVTAVRILFDPGAQEASSSRAILGAGYVVRDDLSEGDHVWMTGSVSTDVEAGWQDPGRTSTIAHIGDRFGTTTSFRDAAEVVPSRTSVNLAPSQETLELGQTMTWTAQTMVSTAPFHDRGHHQVEHVAVLPPGLAYVEGSATSEPVVSEDGDRQTLTWVSEIASGQVHVDTFDTVHTSGVGSHRVVIDVTNLDAETLNHDQDRAQVATIRSAGAALLKEVAASEFAVGGSNQWTITLDNLNNETVEVADTIDILPFHGDDRGTATSATLSVTDLGASEGTEILVTDVDPASIDPDPAHESNGGIGSPSQIWQEWAGQETVTAVRWLSREMSMAERATYTIDFVASGGSNNDALVNSAQSRTMGQATMINSMSTTLIGDPSVLQVNKELVGSDAVLAEGEQLSFEVTVRNPGPGDVQFASVTDHGLEGLRDIAFVDVPVGTVSEDGSTWHVGPLAEGQAVSATVTAIATGGPVRNQVVVSDCEDCIVDIPESCIPNVDVESDTDGCDIVDVEENAILLINKSIISQGGPGEQAEFLIEVGNGAVARDGEVTTARDVTVTDLAGVGLTDVELSEPSTGEIDGTVWSVGHLSAGQVESVRVMATVTESSIVNAAWVSNPDLPRELTDPFDAEPNDSLETDTDQADVVSTSEAAKLAIDKVETSVADGTVVYRIDVANLGSAPATSVTVTDIPGENLSDVELLEPSVGEIDGLTWIVGDLDPGEKQSVRVTAALDGHTGVNQAFVDSPDSPHGGGFEPNDSLASDTDQGDTVTTIADGVADLRIDKRLIGVDAGAAEFEIEICNLGSGPATDVEVIDEGGLGVERLWSADPRFIDGTVFLGDLGVNACETITVGADMSGSGYNVAYVTSPDDPIEPGASQPNNSIAEDIDGWDRVDVFVPATPPPAKPEPLARTGASVGVMGVLGAVLMAGGGAVILRRKM